MMRSGILNGTTDSTDYTDSTDGNVHVHVNVYVYGFIVILVIALTGLLAEHAAGQQVVRQFSKERPAAQSAERGPFLKIAKWSSLVGSAAALGYGIVANRTADRDFESIERLCDATPERCDRLTDGAYADAEMEARYQDVVRLDDRAKFSLSAGQIGLAASVILFIIDLPRDTQTEDIPYEPRRLHIGPRTDGSLQVGYTLTR